MTITTIEKAAKLMGWDDCDVQLIAGHCFVSAEGDTVKDFNPYTNKSDLMDLECALEIHIEWYSDNTVRAMFFEDTFHEEKTVSILHHDNDKFTASAHAVVAVAVQIYDRTNP